MILRLLFCLGLAPLWTSGLMAQANGEPPFSTGLPSEPDPNYDKMVVKATLTEASYRNLGTRASIKQFAPFARSQGKFGTCAAWAAGYAARTIIEAQRQGWTDRAEITRNAYSYGYLYRISASSPTCWGAFLTDCVRQMEVRGIAKLSDFREDCPSSPIPQNVHEAAAPHRIKGSAKLWDEFPATPKKRKIELAKKSIAEGKPLIIAMIIPNSFYRPQNGYWAPAANESATGNYTHGHARHAMCVVGYDDEKFGGAFEIQNSWGANWGDQGYVWISYDHFADFVYQAIELEQFEAVKSNQTIELAGSLRIELDTRQNMQAQWQGQSYKTTQAYRSGTRFRIYLNNNEPAFVYALGSDLTGSLYQVFPYAPNVSPALTYRSNEVPIPSENKHVRMDNKVGTDYLCILYSKEALNLNDLQNRIKQQSNRLSFQQKIQAVLGDKLIPATEIQYERQRMAFKASSRGKSVAMLMLEIEHID